MRKILNAMQQRMDRVYATCALPLLAPLVLAGCMAGGGSLAATSPPGALADDMNNTAAMVARLQQPEGDGKKPAHNPPLEPPPLSLFPDLAPPPAGALTAPSSLGHADVVKVRAWINGRPLYEDEFGMLPNYDLMVYKLHLTPNDLALKESVANLRDTLIDLELMYQDACYKLEKINAKVLDKLKKEGDKKYEENLVQMRENFRKSNAGASDAEFRRKEAGFLDYLKNMSCLLRRQSERKFIAEEYMRSRVLPKIFSIIGPPEVKQEYETHTNQYIYPGKLKWQDVFIPAHEHNNSLAETRKYAETLLNHYRDDFRGMLQFNKGDSKSRGGDGIGTHPTYVRDNKTIPSDVRPVEMEPYLMKMRDGETTLVEMSTGVHIVRLVKKEDWYQRPFNKEVQVEIRNKLRSEVFERERKALIRDLRTRADIVIIAD